MQMQKPNIDESLILNQPNEDDRERSKEVILTRAAKMEQKDTHYVKNADLLKEILQSKVQDELTPRAVEMIVKICKNASQKLYYNNPQDRENCIAYAIEDCLTHWKNFDPTKSDKPNPFAFFTSVYICGYARAWHQMGKMTFPDSIMISLSDNTISL